MAIVSLSAVPKASVLDYFYAKGVLPSVVEWKYYDEAFNRGRERGYIWLRKGQIEGFLGLIPFVAEADGRRQDGFWTCDWSLADPQSSPGMGVRMFQHAAAACGYLAAFGGNETTRQLLPRIATQTIADAGITFHRPLKLGAVLKAVERRIPALRIVERSALSKLPLARRVRPCAEIITRAGIAPDLARHLDAGQGTGWRPRYDLGYVDWQIGRCPCIDTWTCCTRDGKAAVAFWTSKNSTGNWRAAFWSDKGAANSLKAALTGALNQIQDRKGVSVSIVASRHDREAIQVFRALRFVSARFRRPLFLFTPNNSTQPVVEVGGLSYLDTDLAYRF